MDNKGKYIKLGFFIVLGTAFFIFAIFYIGGQQNLFTKTITIYSDFATVSGLNEGSSVRFSGIEVGTVQSISITGPDKVTVSMVIKDDVKEFVKKNSRVIISSDGLVGNKVVAITAGTGNSPSIREGDFLTSEKPVEIGDILESLNASTKDAQKISDEIAQIVGKVNDGKGTIGQLINNESLYNNIDSIMQSYASFSGEINGLILKLTGTVDQVSTEIESFSSGLGTITTNIADITSKINSSESLIGTLLTDTAFANNIKAVIQNTNQTTYNLEQGSLGFYQNMEALKHNFLFKGYFEDLGYWDKTSFEKDVSVKESMLRQQEFEIDEKIKKLEELQKNLKEMQEKIGKYNTGIESNDTTKENNKASDPYKK